MNREVVNSKQDRRDLDIFIGKRIRYRRESLGYTLRNLASQIGITYQQLQKYETGKDSLRLETLLRIGNILNIGLSYFDPVNEMIPELEVLKVNENYNKRNIHMMKIYNNIKCPHIKKHIYQLIINIDKKITMKI